MPFWTPCAPPSAQMVDAGSQPRRRAELHSQWGHLRVLPDDFRKLLRQSILGSSKQAVPLQFSCRSPRSQPPVIPLPPDPGRRGCSRAPSLRGPRSEWEAPAAGGEAGANPRGKEAKGPGCALAGLLHLSTPEEEGGRPPRWGCGSRLGSQSPSARLSHKWLLQPGRRGARCKLAGSRATPGLCSLRDAALHPGRTPRQCPF